MQAHTGLFRWQSNYYPYMTDAYNNTRVNERAVEVPIALSIYNIPYFRHVLEVGAVLPHYLPDWPNRPHTVVDLEEECPAVINEDVLTYEPDRQFSVIICISTLDHLKSSRDVSKAVARMKNWLVDGGILYATVPAMQPPEIGGGSWLDNLVLSGNLGMGITRMDKIDPHGHIWRQADIKTQPLPYGQLSHFANTVYIMVYRR